MSPRFGVLVVVALVGCKHPSVSSTDSGIVVFSSASASASGAPSAVPPSLPFFAHARVDFALGANPRLWAIAVSPDGSKVAGAVERELVVWDAATGAEKNRFKAGYLDPLDAIAFDPSGTHVIAQDRDDTLFDYDVAQGKELWKRETTNWYESAFAMAPDARHLFAGRVLWDLAGPTKLATTENRPDRVAFFDGGKRFIGAQSSRRDTDPPCVVAVFDGATAKPQAKLAPEGICATSLAVSHDSKRIAALANGALWLWSDASHDHEASFPLEPGTNAAAFFGKDAYLVTGGKLLCIYAREGSRRLGCITPPESIGELRVSADEKRLLASTGDSLAFYDLPSVEALAPLLADATSLPAAAAPISYRAPKPEHATRAIWTQRTPMTTPNASPSPSANVTRLVGDAAGLRVYAADGDYAYAGIGGDSPGVLRAPLKGGPAEALRLGSAIDVDTIAVGGGRLFFVTEPISGADETGRGAALVHVASVPLGGGAIEVAVTPQAAPTGLVVVGNVLVGYGQDGIWKRPIAGGTTSVIVKDPVEALAPTPDGTLVYASGLDLARVGLDGKESRRVKPALENPLEKSPTPTVLMLAVSGDETFLVLSWRGVGTFYARQLIDVGSDGQAKAMLAVSGGNEVSWVAVDANGVLAEIYDDDREKERSKKKTRIERIRGPGKLGVLVDDEANDRIDLVPSRIGFLWSSETDDKKGEIWALRPDASAKPPP